MISIEDFLKNEPGPANTHSVIIWFNYGLNEDDSMYNLADALEKKATETGTGVYDGHEIAMDNSDGHFIFMGQMLKPCLKLLSHCWMKPAGCAVLLRCCVLARLIKTLPKLKLSYKP
ncbi:MAG TPA: hypothetical protein VD905_03350 [Flavobacteriales bacterium]|nr:hypothetical protein [Flavobacteriales bacterium]